MTTYKNKQGGDFPRPMLYLFALIEFSKVTDK